MDSREIAGRLRGYLEAHPGDVAAAYLFGSVARGTAAPGSDVDVAILRAGGVPRTLDELPIELEGDLEAVLALPVQVKDIVERRLGDLLEFVEAIRKRLAG